jgi:hypothetical protein
MSKLITLMLLMMISAPGKCAESTLSWPRFRGPNGSGIATDAKPPIEIGPTKNVKWQVRAPSGLSSPIIAGEKIVLTALDGDKLYTIAYRRSDGTEVWRANRPSANESARLPQLQTARYMSVLLNISTSFQKTKCRHSTPTTGRANSGQMRSSTTHAACLAPHCQIRRHTTSGG